MGTLPFDELATRSLNFRSTARTTRASERPVGLALIQGDCHQRRQNQYHETGGRAFQSSVSIKFPGFEEIKRTSNLKSSYPCRGRQSHDLKACRKHDRKTDLRTTLGLSCLTVQAVGEDRERFSVSGHKWRVCRLQRQTTDDVVDN